METGTVIMMIIILGGIWGGFAYTLRVAVKKEARKRDELWPISK